MHIVLEPTLFGRPVALDEPVMARIDRPDGGTAILTLSREEDGFYRGRYYDTDALGIYHVAAEVNATSPEGVKLTRSRYRLSDRVHRETKTQEG